MVTTMKNFSLVLYVVLAVLWSAASASYDNPEQDPLPPGPDSAKELHRKWDFEVLQILSRGRLWADRHLKHWPRHSGRSLAFLPLHIWNMSSVWLTEKHLCKAKLWIILWTMSMQYSLNLNLFLWSDIGIIGAPFDTAVSYRPGKRWMFLLYILTLSSQSICKTIVSQCHTMVQCCFPKCRSLSLRMWSKTSLRSRCCLHAIVAP